MPIIPLCRPFHIIVMVWPFPAGSIMNYNWIGPTHNAKHLRSIKQHLESVGIAYAQRSPGEFDALANRGPHDRATGSGTLLSVSVHSSIGPACALAMEIDAAGSCFISRTALPHSSAPNARYYASTRPDVSVPTSWLYSVSVVMCSPGIWLRYVMIYTAFMFPQGWMAGDSIQHQVMEFHIETVIRANCTH